MSGIKRIEAEGQRLLDDGQMASRSYEELGLAANCYAEADGTGMPASWPWGEAEWKAGRRVENLVRAGALYLIAAQKARRAGQDGDADVFGEAMGILINQLDIELSLNPEAEPAGVAADPVGLKPELQVFGFELWGNYDMARLVVTMKDIGIPGMTTFSPAATIRPPEFASYRILVDDDSGGSLKVTLLVEVFDRPGVAAAGMAFEIGRATGDRRGVELAHLAGILQDAFNVQLERLMLRPIQAPTNPADRAKHDIHRVASNGNEEARGTFKETFELSEADVAALKKNAANTGTKRWRRFGAQRLAIAATVVVALGFIGYGTLQAFSTPKDPFQDAMSRNDFSKLRSDIAQQMAKVAEQGDASVAFALQGKNNVTVDTLKAMGLDPGKANAGCLVGTK